ncbi:Putative pentatricopeptide repeat-containing protein At3g47840 [Linum perenne]
MLQQQILKLAFGVPFHIRKLSYVSATAQVDSQDFAVGYSMPIDVCTRSNVQNTTLNMVEINSQLKLLVKTDCLTDARKMFDDMPCKDEISWTTLISGYVSAMNSAEALTLFSRMRVEPLLQMDPFIISIALKACGRSSSVRFGELLHGYSIKTDFVSSVFVGSALLDMYAKVGQTHRCLMMFAEMPLRNVVTWTAIITGLVRTGYYKEGLIYFSEMWRSKVVCDSHTFAIALKACADLGALDHGREIHCQTIKKGFHISSFVANTLTVMYNKCGKMGYGSCLFEQMELKDVVSWTTAIATYSQNGDHENAIRAFRKMRGTGVCPNEYTFAAVITSCANLSSLRWGEQLHAHVFCLGLVDYLSLTNSIITMYSRCGQLDAASNIFQRMSRRDIISWSTMIGEYSKGGCGEKAFEYLSEMRKDGPQPNEFALASVLSVCGNLATLEQGQQLHAHALRIGLERDAMIRSSLINMYCKCGSIPEASKVFSEAKIDCLVSWTSMINGYAEHGLSKQAINLFEKFRKLGQRPDSVIFIGVLTACSHVGLVELGFHYFNLMNDEYKILPSKEHYGCMIDLLGRAGRLSDAEDMIESMPFQKDDVVWSTLLRACMVHGDVDRGKRIAQKILELDPNCAGTHITLANLYAAKGRWKEVAEVRKMLKWKGITKETGSSWIKMRDEVSTFTSGDYSHPRANDIYNVLDLLSTREDEDDIWIDYDPIDVEDQQR